MFSSVFSWFASDDEPKPAPPDERVRVLLPVSGGPNAPAALGILPGLASAGHRITLLHVARPGEPPLEGIAERFAGVRDLRAREVISTDVAGAIVEATADADVLVLGASEERLVDALPLEIVRRSRCPAIVVRRRRDPRRVGRDGPRALVVAQTSECGALAIDRALRWAREGSAAQQLLIGRGADSDALNLEILPPNSGIARVRSRVAPGALDAPAVLRELERGGHDLVVIAADPDRLRDRQRWIDEVAARASCAIVTVFTSRSGPPTKRRRVAGAVV